jgi:hypothetical protein
LRPREGLAGPKPAGLLPIGVIMTILGARVICCACGAMPHPCCELVQQDFTLRRFDSLGRPSEGGGLWFCEAHYPASRKRPSRVSVSPGEAIDRLERLLSNEDARLVEAVAEQDDLVGALEDYRREVAHAVTELRREITA